ncbi:MAG: hypothetical protein GY820_34390 [Gammaproteobacteria bacterium]|nr:hypothetical protein [Gammaproteobacteria bacterium]
MDTSSILHIVISVVPVVVMLCCEVWSSEIGSRIFFHRVMDAEAVSAAQEFDNIEDDDILDENIVFSGDDAADEVAVVCVCRSLLLLCVDKSASERLCMHNICSCLAAL